MWSSGIEDLLLFVAMVLKVEDLFVSRLYNLILPSSMGGDVVRIYRLGKLNSNMEVAAASVIHEPSSARVGDGVGRGCVSE